MKKFAIALVMMIFLGGYAYSDEVTEYCAKEPEGIGNSFTRFMSNVTGLNFIETKIYEAVIQNSLKKELNSKFNVELYPYGAKSLSDGKFKKITLESKHITSPYAYITDFKAESLCSYNSANFDENSFYFTENFVARFEGKITDSDLKKMLENEIKKANNVNFSVAGINLFKISNADVSIKNKRIHIEMDVEYSNFIVTKKAKVRVNTALAIKDGEIIFADTKIGSNLALNTQTLSPLMNLINPFNTKVKIDDYNTAQSRITKLEFKDNEIEIQGVVVVLAYNKN